MESAETNRRYSFLILKDEQIFTEEEAKSPKMDSSSSNTKSILKPCKLRRSMSMESNEVNHKRVAFGGPQSIVDISFIDAKMKKSRIDENADLNGHRQRSFTVPNTPNYFSHKIPIKTVPNFKVIHEQKFNKMESLTDHAQRKAERAKKLLTPTPLRFSSIFKTKSEGATLSAPKEEKSNFIRNSETRTPINRNQMLKRPAKLPFNGPPNKIQKTSPNGDTDKNRASISSIDFVKKESPIAKLFSKITGRNSIATTTDLPERIQLKGVRLNRRFELQMKHQQLYSPPQGR